jgi:hypothetical protein
MGRRASPCRFPLTRLSTESRNALITLSSSLPQPLLHNLGSLAARFAFAIHPHSLPLTLQHTIAAHSIPPPSPFAVILTVLTSAVCSAGPWRQSKGGAQQHRLSCRHSHGSRSRASSTAVPTLVPLPIASCLELMVARTGCRYATILEMADVDCTPNYSCSNHLKSRARVVILTFLVFYLATLLSLLYTYTG